MPRPRNFVPSYRRHKQSGQAVVTIRTPDGARRDVLLGPYGSPDSRAAYERVLAETRAAPAAALAGGPAARDLSVNEVLVAYWAHALQHYRHPDGTPTSEVDEVRRSLRPVRELYGPAPAREFGPLALKAVRQRMVDAGLCRPLVNKRVGRVRRAFKWAASEELVAAAAFQALATVAGLQRGRSAAREPDAVPPAPVEHVLKALEVMVPTVRAMVRLQLLAGLRPEAVRGLTPEDVDRTGPLWVYRPAKHKTTWRGRVLAVPLGPRARAVLEPFLDDAPAGRPVFSPAAAKEERYRALRAKRKSRVTPSQACRRTDPATHVKRTGDRFTDHGYAARVRRACVRAGVPPFAPNQLRHTFATEVRRLFGLEAAQVLLGHARADVTQVYAERDHDLAARVAAQIG